MKRLAYLFVFAVLAVSAPAPAKATLLSDLIGLSQSISAGNLLFSDFSYLKSGDMPVDSGINVVPYFDGNDWGIKIQGAFHDLPGGSASDALIEFKVTVTDPGAKITSVKLAGNPTVIGGNGGMSVVETFFPDDYDNLLAIYWNEPGSVKKLVDVASFSGDGYTSLHVQKDILATSAGASAIPQMSFITQTYHVVGGSNNPIPEPSTMTLLGIGGCGVAVTMIHRRRATR